MRKIAFLTFLAAITCTLGFNRAAYADVEFSNLANYSTNGTSIIGSDPPNSMFTPQVSANEFTAAFSGTISTVEVPVIATEFSPVNSPLILVLYLNDPTTGTPLTSSEQVLADFTATGMPATQFGGIPLLTMTTNSPITLEAGQSYWLGILPAVPQDFVIWASANDPSSAPTAVSSDGGTTYSPSTGPEAFEVDAVPEPSSWVLLGLGVGALLGFRSRRRAAVAA